MFSQITSASSYTEEVDQQLSDSIGFQSLKFACLFAFDMILKIKDAQQFVQWMSLLEQIIKGQPGTCLWLIKYLTTEPKIFEEILLVH